MNRSVDLINMLICMFLWHELVGDGLMDHVTHVIKFYQPKIIENDDI